MRYFISLSLISFSLHAGAKSVDELLKSVEERAKQATPPSAVVETPKVEVPAPTRAPASVRPKKKKKVAPPVVPAPTAVQPSDNKPSLDIPTNQTPVDDDSKALNFAAVYKGDAWSNTSGGARRKSVFIQNLDLKLDANFAKIAHLKGLRAFVYAVGQTGEDRDGGPGLHVGNLQLIDNTETKTDGFRVYEAYLEQTLFSDSVSLLAGVHDLNSEFYVTESSGLFLNPSFGIGAEMGLSGVNGPSIWPVAAPAVRLKVTPAPEFYMQMGIFNGQAGDPKQTHGTVWRANNKDGQLLVNEAGWVHGKGAEKGYVKVLFGAWNYTKPADHHYLEVTDAQGNTVPKAVNNHGYYVLTEHSFAKGMTAFVRYGVANGEANIFDSCLGTGVQWIGLIPSREADRLGLAYVRAHASGAYKESVIQNGDPTPEDSESVIEVTYRAQINDHVALQPDYQWVFDPGVNPQLDNAQVFGLRLELGF